METELVVEKIAEECTERGAEKEVQEIAEERIERGVEKEVETEGDAEIAERVRITEKAESVGKVPLGTKENFPHETAPQKKATQETSHSFSSILGSHLPNISSFSSVLATSMLCCGIVSFLPLSLQLLFGDHLKTQLLLIFPIRLPQLQ